MGIRRSSSAHQLPAEAGAGRWRPGGSVLIEVEVDVDAKPDASDPPVSGPNFVSVCDGITDDVRNVLIR